MALNLKVNGRSEWVEMDPSRPLLEVLREGLGLFGARRGCETSYCGACSVLLDGQVVHACTVLAGMAEGHEVTTIEGISSGEALHPVQSAFIQAGAIQCGYCTPGMVLAAISLLQHEPNPTEEQIRQWIRGNLCRCTGYQKVVAAIAEAAATLGRGGGIHA